MSDITRDDLRLPGKLLSQAELHTMWSLTRPPTDEEFKRLVREWLTQGRNGDEISAAIARGWMLENPGQALKALLDDEGFDRLARQAGYIKVDILNRDGNVVSIHEWARDWVVENPAKALRALLTDECETCGGTGDVVAALGSHKTPTAINCPDCGGRGWLPNKKAQELLDNLHDYVAKAPEVAQDPRIFADWLEAEDEN